MSIIRRGVEQSVARRAHNPEVVGSNPSPATTCDGFAQTRSRRAIRRRSLVGYSGRFIPGRSLVRIRPPLPQFGPMVKRLRHRPFTAVTRVRVSVGSPQSHNRSHERLFHFGKGGFARLECAFYAPRSGIPPLRRYGDLAQLVRALALQARGQRFKSASLHHQTQ